MVRASLPIQTPHSSMGVFHWRAVLRIFDFTRQRRFCVQASQFQKERMCVLKCSFTTVQCLNVRFLSLNVQVLSAISARRRLNIVGMNIDVFWCHNWITLSTKHHWRWTPPTNPCHRGVGVTNPSSGRPRTFSANISETRTLCEFRIIREWNLPSRTLRTIVKKIIESELFRSF